MTREELFERMKGSIIVSCQATPGEPLYDPDRSVMPLMARAARQAGAKMIRTSSVRDIVGIKEETGLPVIGLIKIANGKVISDAVYRIPCFLQDGMNASLLSNPRDRNYRDTVGGRIQIRVLHVRRE